jgi:PAS domain S-box-containing protein
MMEDITSLCEEKVSRFVEFSKDGILIIDETGSLIAWNPAMEQISGRPRSEVLGKKVWDIQYSLLPDARKLPATYDHLRDLVMTILETGRSSSLERTHEHEIQRGDFTVRTVESFLFTIPAQKGFLVSGIMRDITDRKQADHALMEANRKLNLMSSITRHDINNQLMIISGYLMLLETGSPALPPGEIIGILNRAAAKIQKILAFTKEYQDVGVKSPVWQPLSGIIGAAISTLGTSHLTISIAPSCRDVEVFADPMIVKVFYNLVDNSLRHGETVSEIRVSCNRENDDLTIVYEDNGTGIADAIRPVLFERGKGKNTGYGMFLIREILAITGFTIAEKGTSAQGVRFEIRVPRGSYRTPGTGMPAPARQLQ